MKEKGEGVRRIAKNGAQQNKMKLQKTRATRPKGRMNRSSKLGNDEGQEREN